jgi:hypothetical protein
MAPNRTDDRLSVRAVLGTLILAVGVFGLVGFTLNSTVHLSPAPVAKLVTSVSPAPTNTPTALPTLAPTPVPTAVPTAVPTPVPAPPLVKTVPKRVFPISSIHNLLIVPGSAPIPVSTYSDCSKLPSGQMQPLAEGVAAVDTCLHWDTYFLGHNPGVFTHLFSAANGEILTWYDSVGHVRHFRIVSHTDQNGGIAFYSGPFDAEFQTCIDPAGVKIRVFHAVLA